MMRRPDIEALPIRRIQGFCMLVNELEEGTPRFFWCESLHSTAQHSPAPNRGAGCSGRRKRDRLAERTSEPVVGC